MSEIDSAKFRERLIKALTDTEIKALCLDHFPSVYNTFGDSLDKSQKIHRLIEHCIRHNTMSILLEKAQESHPKQFSGISSIVLPATTSPIVIAPQGRNYKELISELGEWKIVHQNTQKLLLNIYPLERIVERIQNKITNNLINNIQDTWFTSCKDDAERIANKFDFNFIKNDIVLELSSTLNKEPDLSKKILDLSTESIREGRELKWSIIELRKKLERVLVIADVVIIQIVEVLERET